MNNTYKKNLLHRMKIAQGHFAKVIEMIENDVYCLNITQQTFAIQNALKKIDELILENHLKTCVRSSLINDENVEEKVAEILQVFQRK